LDIAQCDRSQIHAGSGLPAKRYRSLNSSVPPQREHGRVSPLTGRSAARRSCDKRRVRMPMWDSNFVGVIGQSSLYRWRHLRPSSSTTKWGVARRPARSRCLACRKTPRGVRNRPDVRPGMRVRFAVACAHGSAPQAQLGNAHGRLRVAARFGKNVTTDLPRICPVPDKFKACFPVVEPAGTRAARSG
jgi:hypothetical protein